MNLEDLGITKEELAERIVERAAEMVLNTRLIDSVYEDHLIDHLSREVKDELKKVAGAHAERLCEAVMAPRIREMVDAARIDGKLTIEEYIAKRCDGYLQDEVRFDGKSHDECGPDWYGAFRDTRVVWLIERIVNDEIGRVVRSHIYDAKSKIAQLVSEHLARHVDEIMAKATGAKP